MNTLASLFNFPALSKVQINSARTLRDSRIGDSRPDEDLPFWFLQRSAGEFLEVRSPGGYAALVHPTDICDVVPAEPLVISAVPQALFIEWLGRPLSQRDSPLPTSSYRPAQLLWVTKDRWSRVDGIFVHFLDEAYNTSHKFSAPVDGETRKMLNDIARPERMPIANYRTAAAVTAVTRQLPAARQAEKVIRRFFKGALSGNGPRADSLLPLATGQ